MLELDANQITLPGDTESTFVMHHYSGMSGVFGCNVDAATGKLIETEFCSLLVPYLENMVVAHPEIHGLWVDVKANMAGADLARLVRTVRAAVGDVNVMYELTPVGGLAAKSHEMASSVSRELDSFCDASRGTLASLSLYTGAGVHGSLTLAMCPDLNPVSPACLCEHDQFMLAAHGGCSPDSDGNPRTIGKMMPFAFGDGGVDRFLTQSGAAAIGLDFHLDGMLFDYPSQIGDFQRILEVVAADPALRVAVRSDRFNVVSRNTTADPTVLASSTATTVVTTVAPTTTAAVMESTTASPQPSTMATTSAAQQNSHAQVVSLCGAAVLSALLFLS
jgi:hypothetical protein